MNHVLILSRTRRARVRLRRSRRGPCLRERVPLEKNFERDLGRAAAAKEIDCEMEIDVDSLGQAPCIAAVVSGPLQLGAAPVDDALYLWVSRECCFCRSHVSLYFVPNGPVVSPRKGGFHTPDLTHDWQKV